jgi:hypothetical protein
MNFTSKKPQFEHLHKKWTARKKSLEENFWSIHGQPLRQLAIGSLGGLMLLSSPTASPSTHNLVVSRDDVLKGYDQNVLLAQQLGDKMPNEVRPLDQSEEKEILDVLSRNLGFKVKSEINDIRLNRNYGLIGGEQHLYRYPGDNVYAHAENTVDWAKYGGAGIAPGLGAWGYFAPSKEQFTKDDEIKERYYLAIQTFLAPGFAENVGKYRDFFKFRKMLVVNPKTGQAVVAVIGDAGPAEFTGKHLGGSPEVMDELGLAGGPRKGAVLYFFIDDEENKVPLGPVKIEKEA